MTMTNPDRLYIYVVYDHPSDFPDEIVCRRQYVENGVVRAEPDLFARYLTLAAMRMHLTSLRLTYLGRAESDDPAILETWL